MEPVAADVGIFYAIHLRVLRGSDGTLLIVQIQLCCRTDFLLILYGSDNAFILRAVYIRPQHDILVVEEEIGFFGHQVRRKITVPVVVLEGRHGIFIHLHAAHEGGLIKGLSIVLSIAFSRIYRCSGQTVMVCIVMIG